MTVTETDGFLLASSDLCSFSVAFSPAAWYLGTHLLKCIQDASSQSKCGLQLQRKSTPRLNNVDKATQTPASYSQKRTSGSRDTRKSIHKRPESRAAAADSRPKTTKAHVDDRRDVPRRADSRASTKGAKPRPNSVCETKPVGRTAKSESHHNQSIVHKAADKTDHERSKISSSSMYSRPTQGRVARDRRNSADDWQKRTSEPRAEKDRANWLENPVFIVSEGVSDGLRTDRSEMSPPWKDISIAEMHRQGHGIEKPPALSSLKETAKTVVQKPVPVRVQPTLPTSEPVKGSMRTINQRKHRRVSAIVPAAKPPEMTPNELSIRETIERKLGRSLEGMSIADMKSISVERMKQLTEKYATRKSRSSQEREAPASSPLDPFPRAMDSAESFSQNPNQRQG